MRYSHVHNVLVPRKKCLLNLIWIYSPREFTCMMWTCRTDLPELVQVAVTCTLALEQDGSGTRCSTRMDHIPTAAQTMSCLPTLLVSYPQRTFLFIYAIKHSWVYLKHQLNLWASENSCPKSPSGGLWLSSILKLYLTAWTWCFFPNLELSWHY